MKQLGLERNGPDLDLCLCFLDLLCLCLALALAFAFPFSFAFAFFLSLLTLFLETILLYVPFLVTVIAFFLVLPTIRPLSGCRVVSSLR